jgi:hypothetical protein
MFNLTDIHFSPLSLNNRNLIQIRTLNALVKNHPRFKTVGAFFAGRLERLRQGEMERHMIALVRFDFFRHQDGGGVYDLLSHFICHNQVTFNPLDLLVDCAPLNVEVAANAFTWLIAQLWQYEVDPRRPDTYQ